MIPLFPIDYVAFSHGLAKTLAGTNRHVRDQWLRAAQSIPLNIAEDNGKQSFKDKNRLSNGILAHINPSNKRN